MKTKIIGALVLGAAITAGVYAGKQNERKALAIALKKAQEQAAKPPAYTLTNATMLVIGNAALVRITDAQWMELSKQYPTNAITNTINFYK